MTRLAWTIAKDCILLAAARNGESWTGIAAKLGIGHDAVKHAFIRVATADDRAVRRKNVLERLRHQPARRVDKRVAVSDDTGFSGIVFTDDPRAGRKPLGRATSAVDPRFSLAASSFGGWTA